MRLDENTIGYLYALAAVSIWSGFILVSRMGGLSELLSYDVIAIRYATSGLILLPIWLFLFPFTLWHKKYLISALFGGVFYALFAFRGFELSSASHAAILLPGLMPLAISVFSAVMLNTRFTSVKWLGIGTITLAIILLGIQQYRSSNSLALGDLSLMAAALCWAMYSVLVVRWEISPWQATVSLALITCILYLPFYVLFLPKNISAQLWQDILLQGIYQGFFATIVQLMLFIKAVQLIGAPAMGSMMALVPIIAGSSAIVLFDEAVTLELLAAVLLVSLGVWLANTSLFNKPIKTESSCALDTN